MDNVKLIEKVIRNVIPYIRVSRYNVGRRVADGGAALNEIYRPSRRANLETCSATSNSQILPSVSPVYRFLGRKEVSFAGPDICDLQVAASSRDPGINELTKDLSLKMLHRLNSAIM